jgi:hypothetical protein
MFGSLNVQWALGVGDPQAQVRRDLGQTVGNPQVQVHLRVCLLLLAFVFELCLVGQLLFLLC